MQLTMQKLVLVIIGLIVGSLVGALLSFPLSKLPDPFDKFLPITVTIVSALCFIVVFYSQHRFLQDVFPRASKSGPDKQPKLQTKPYQILVDTSVIIDGRIADIVETGFILGTLLVPRFILAELQNIADSEDNIRRNRGRRGLEILNLLRQNKLIQVEIIDDDPREIKEVDAKLVSLAKKYGADVLTTDYNLNRVASIEKVEVLNINELANAIKPVVLPGEELHVKVVQAGKEKNQGVGYLPDGTMIVVENGDRLIGKEVVTEVTRIFQTVAGKMVFAVEKKAKSSGSQKNPAKR